MKILVVGDWHSELHEEAVFGAFQKLGHEVFRFAWHRYFQFNEKSFWSWFSRIYHKAQNKYLFGPILGAINCDLIKMVHDVHPDFIFVYRGTHVFSQTLRQIKNIYPNTILAGYNNDDPFSKHYGSVLWRHFLRSVPEYDVVFAYRIHNIKEYKDIGAKSARLLRSWYISERNYPVLLSSKEQEEYGCDVVFVGHYEDDGRLEILEEIVKQGFHLKLYGPGYEWDDKIRNSIYLQHLLPIQLVWGDEYNKALGGASIALCFLSKINRDSYTRRCFEIPAVGTMLLSEYSADLMNLFIEGEEAEFFRNKEEAVKKIDYYINQHKRKCQLLAKSGQACVVNGGNDVGSRMQRVLSVVGNDV